MFYLTALTAEESIAAPGRLSMGKAVVSIWVVREYVRLLAMVAPERHAAGYRLERHYSQRPDIRPPVHLCVAKTLPIWPMQHLPQMKQLCLKAQFVGRVIVLLCFKLRFHREDLHIRNYALSNRVVVHDSIRNARRSFKSQRLLPPGWDDQQNDGDPDRDSTDGIQPATGWSCFPPVEHQALATRVPGVQRPRAEGRRPDA